ncbi:Uncharacterised protein [Mycobacteroides abscessus subsp. abscessus]|nr:Uncharacterised protein [Mycobacteroides abscessus subsp. abscessus]
MRYPGEADDDGDDMPRGTGLMTLEEAAETIRHEHGYKR